MKPQLSSCAARASTLALALLWCACAGEKPGPSSADLGVAGVSRAGENASGGSAPSSGVAGANAGGAASPLGGAPPLGAAGSVSASASGSGSAGTGSGGMNDGGTNGGAGSAGMSNAAGSAGAASGAAGGPAIPAGCMVSNPVSFKADIGPWLNSSCGKGKGGGCHVTDDSSTTNSACPDGTNKCGFNHAYDWITAGSHNQYCKQTPGPIRYTVVLDVIRSANPPSCTSTRIMPPDGPPVSECQKAALTAWLAEPMVLQLHRTDDTSPTTPYLMPPFN